MFKPLILLLSSISLIACQSNSLNDQYVNRYKHPQKAISETEKQIRKQYLIANDYYYGFDRKQNQKKACDIYESLALKQDPESIHSYGNCFSFGEGREKNYDKACSLFDKASQFNIPAAQNSLGSCYEFGSGKIKNLDLAMYWYKKAAYQGYSLAIQNIADLELEIPYVENSNNNPIPRLVNHENCKLAETRAQKNDSDAIPSKSEAIFLVGLCYHDNLGFKQDDSKAYDWFKRAAKTDIAEAQFQVGYYLFKGKGIKANKNRAIYWFNLAAAQKNHQAEFYLGEYYYMGHTNKKDYTQSFYWFEKAANGGSIEGMLRLSESYKDGKGTEKNDALATYWLQEASKQKELK
ncbi:tetratricopeptide repeat protein [Marinomonas sp. PE14-40]|uniref:tetratricopeptide repeat protein n=1 Tax=Marinomonas sp. PE14-40 TaxID=3060621 RepID=UPI003F66FAFC